MLKVPIDDDDIVTNALGATSHQVVFVQIMVVNSSKNRKTFGSVGFIFGAEFVERGETAYPTKNIRYVLVSTLVPKLKLTQLLFFFSTEDKTDSDAEPSSSSGAEGSAMDTS